MSAYCSSSEARVIMEAIVRAPQDPCRNRHKSHPPKPVAWPPVTASPCLTETLLRQSLGWRLYLSRRARASPTCTARRRQALLFA